MDNFDVFCQCVSSLESFVATVTNMCSYLMNDFVGSKERPGFELLSASCTNSSSV